MVRNAGKEHAMARHRRRLLLLMSVVLILPACGRSSQTASTTTTTTTASSTLPSTTSTSAATSTSTTAVSTTTTTAPRATGYSVYFAHDGHLAVAHRSVPATSMPATAAVRSLLAGPNGFEQATGLTSAVSSTVGLRSVSISSGTATVSLTAGGLSTMARAQVVFTLTQFPTVQRVVIDGGAPLSRADFESVAPQVLVESPGWGDTVTSPLRVRGSANTFEAVFRLEVTDWDGRIVASEVLMATSGTGTRGTFDTTLRYAASRTGLGELIASYDSPKDGSRVVVEEIPLTVSAT
jgi:germination protein M